MKTIRVVWHFLLCITLGLVVSNCKPRRSDLSANREVKASKRLTQEMMQIRMYDNLKNYAAIAAGPDARQYAELYRLMRKSQFYYVRIQAAVTLARLLANDYPVLTQVDKRGVPQRLGVVYVTGKEDDPNRKLRNVDDIVRETFAAFRLPKEFINHPSAQKCAKNPNYRYQTCNDFTTCGLVLFAFANYAQNSAMSKYDGGINELQQRVKGDIECINDEPMRKILLYRYESMDIWKLFHRSSGIDDISNTGITPMISPDAYKILRKRLDKVIDPKNPLNMVNQKYPRTLKASVVRKMINESLVPTTTRKPVRVKNLGPVVAQRPVPKDKQQPPRPGFLGLSDEDKRAVVEMVDHIGAGHIKVFESNWKLRFYLDRMNKQDPRPWLACIVKRFTWWRQFYKSSAVFRSQPDRFDPIPRHKLASKPQFDDRINLNGIGPVSYDNGYGGRVILHPEVNTPKGFKIGYNADPENFQCLPYLVPPDFLYSMLTMYSKMEMSLPFRQDYLKVMKIIKDGTPIPYRKYQFVKMPNVKGVPVPTKIYLANIRYREAEKAIEYNIQNFVKPMLVRYHAPELLDFRREQKIAEKVRGFHSLMYQLNKMRLNLAGYEKESLMAQLVQMDRDEWECMSEKKRQRFYNAVPPGFCIEDKIPKKKKKLTFYKRFTTAKGWGDNWEKFKFGVELGASIASPTYSRIRPQAMRKFNKWASDTWSGFTHHLYSMFNPTARTPKKQAEADQRNLGMDQTAENLKLACYLKPKEIGGDSRSIWTDPKFKVEEPTEPPGASKEKFGPTELQVKACNNRINANKYTEAEQHKAWMSNPETRKKCKKYIHPPKPSDWKPVNWGCWKFLMGSSMDTSCQTFRFTKPQEGKYPLDQICSFKSPEGNFLDHRSMQMRVDCWTTVHKKVAECEPVTMKAYETFAGILATLVSAGVSNLMTPAILRGWGTIAFSRTMQKATGHVIKRFIVASFFSTLRSIPWFITQMWGAASFELVNRTINWVLGLAPIYDFSRTPGQNAGDFISGMVNGFMMFTLLPHVKAIGKYGPWKGRTAEIMFFAFGMPALEHDIHDFVQFGSEFFELEKRTSIEIEKHQTPEKEHWMHDLLHATALTFAFELNHRPKRKDLYKSSFAQTKGNYLIAREQRRRYRLIRKIEKLENAVERETRNHYVKTGTFLGSTPREIKARKKEMLMALDKIEMEIQRMPEGLTEPEKIGQLMADLKAHRKELLHSFQILLDPRLRSNFDKKIEENLIPLPQTEVQRANDLAASWKFIGIEPTHSVYQMREAWFKKAEELYQKFNSKKKLGREAEAEAFKQYVELRKARMLLENELNFYEPKPPEIPIWF